MKVGAMKMSFHVTEAQSLKQKRGVIRSLKDRIASRFECAISEVGDHDLWQRAELGVAIVSLDAQGADSKLRKIEEFARLAPGATLLEVDRDILTF